MPVINVAYEINQTVYHVTLDSGVREGVVRSSKVVINPTSTVITYNIGYTLPFIGCGTSSSEALEADLFSEIGQAMTEYQDRIEAA